MFSLNSKYHEIFERMYRFISWRDLELFISWRARGPEGPELCIMMSYWGFPSKLMLNSQYREFLQGTNRIISWRISKSLFPEGRSPEGNNLFEILQEIICLYPKKTHDIQFIMSPTMCFCLHR